MTPVPPEAAPPRATPGKLLSDLALLDVLDLYGERSDPPYALLAIYAAEILKLRAPLAAPAPPSQQEQTDLGKTENDQPQEPEPEGESPMSPERAGFHDGHAIALHMVIELARQVPLTGDEQADQNIRNSIARAREVQRWLEPLVRRAPTPEPACRCEHKWQVLIGGEKQCALCGLRVERSGDSSPDARKPFHIRVDRERAYAALEALPDLYLGAGGFLCECNCAATPPTMPTYRTTHLPTCPAYGAADSLAGASVPAVDPSRSIPDAVAPTVAAPAPESGTPEYGPLVDVPYEEKDWPRWLMLVAEREPRSRNKATFAAISLALAALTERATRAETALREMKEARNG